jgi:hypothetical protein
MANRLLIEPMANTLSVMVGCIAIVIAATTLTTDMSIRDVAFWLQETVGTSFPIFLGCLSAVAIFSWVQICSPQPRKVAYAIGIHAASGITTLALTYTLFGISMGIGSIANTSLTPETVTGVIGDLTKGFQLAFLTTVIGLPISASLRALLQVTATHVFDNSSQQEI